MWIVGRVVMTLDLRSIGREFESWPLRYIECNPGQVVNTHVPLSPSSIIWNHPMGGDSLRLGTGKVTVGLASHWPCVSQYWYYHLRARSLKKGDEHPA